MGAVKNAFIKRRLADGETLTEEDMSVDENGFYHPPAREGTGFDRTLYCKFIPNMPAANAYISKYDDEGAPVEISVGEITGWIKRWAEVTVKNGDSTKVAEIALDMPGTEWHNKIISIFAWSGSLYDSLEHVAADRDKMITLRRVADDGKRHCYAVKQHDAPSQNGHHQEAPAPKAGKPTTAQGWGELYRSFYDRGMNAATKAKILNQAAEDGFSFIEQELRFVSVTAATTEQADVDDLPF